MPKPRRRRATTGSPQTATRPLRTPRPRFSLRVARLPRLDEPIDGRLERYAHPEPLGLTDEGAVDQLELGRPAGLDVLEHRREMPVAALRREDVHLPRVVVQLDARGCGYRLSLVDEVADEVAEVEELRRLGEVEVVRELRQRGDAVHRRVEDQLRPLRRAQVRERLRLQAARLDQLGSTARVALRCAAIGADPRRGVEDVLDVRVAVPRADAEREGREERPLAVRGDELLRLESILNSQ